jgi:hypothetical protein
MSRLSISAAVRNAVRERAGNRCEYCRMPEFSDPDREEARHSLWQAGQYPD